jgi:hypothetical protein
METSKKILGADHPDTLTNIYNLAFTWKSQGRDGEAIRLMNDCVLSRIQILGPGHPNTISSLAALNSWEAEKTGIDRSIEE